MDPRLTPPPRPDAVDMIGKQNGVVKPKPTLCPFGCKEDEPSMTAHGYCRHLIGWTTDGKTFERRERVVNTDFEFVRGKHPVLESDTCVPLSSGLRVYRKSGRAPVLVARPVSEKLMPETPDEVFPEEADLEELTKPTVTA